MVAEVWKDALLQVCFPQCTTGNIERVDFSFGGRGIGFCDSSANAIYEFALPASHASGP